MKKIFFILSLLFVTLSVSAAPELKVESGKWSSLKGENAIVCVEFDYSAAKWEEGQSYETFCEETYEPRVKASVEDFISSFNEYSSGLKMSKDVEEAKYKLIFRINNIERKMANFGWGRFYIRLYGSIEIVDLASHTNVCTIAVSKLSGDADYIPEDRLSKCFRALAEKLVNLKK